jgi:F1F0 ATPase subunit 2
MASSADREGKLMSIIIKLLIGLVAGLLIGIFNYNLLWLTVRYITQSNRLVVIMIVSFFLRMAVVLGVFYLLAIRTGWISVLAGLVGMILMRTVLIKKYGPESERHSLRKADEYEHQS